MSVPFLLTSTQMRRIRPHFPLSHGVPRVDDRRVLSGIIFVLKGGLRWRDAPPRRDAACGAAHERQALGDRLADHTAPGLRSQPAHPQADRGDLCLGRGDWRDAPHPVARDLAGRMELHAARRHLQPDPIAIAIGDACLIVPRNGPGAVAFGGSPPKNSRISPPTSAQPPRQPGIPNS